MLSQQTIEIVKSTAPLLAQTGPEITTHFYDRMLNRHPELKDIFNMSNQLNHAQHQALFNAVHGYAANIDNLEVLLPVVEKIAQKHTSFNISPDMYAIVGENLLATIDAFFSPGQAVLDAWAEAYGVLADVFIHREKEIYQAQQDSVGGWRGTRTFKVVEKEKRSDVITSFVFAPVDGGPIANFKPGQYLGIHIQSDQFEHQEIRQYSLAAAPSANQYRIAVKREDSGKVSNFLHDEIHVGDSVELTPPCGDFFLDIGSQTPVTLISAGVGLTPMMSMLETLSGKHQAGINWLHAAENGRTHAFSEESTELIGKHRKGERHIWYRTPEAGDLPGEHFDHKGIIDLSSVDHITKDPEQIFYMCGPVGFMQSVAKQLTQAGVSSDRIHYECFGPHKVL
ncbi:NO-inducible flavohemoprotein [Veronia pacifica]|uniref:Flavohemoprotein n=1 Tax=Veronia pacifica TaxID=1080227 RepID=A0A1C3ED25_9GAMM|nr:NO-inducible flavohemoprotein [Veronia pacifica]ODA31156.1 nitric oxide dioxygenase [Veronia pacifica]